ncbi:MAG: hydroxyacylglutathione hydrolase [Paracoccaceae bacterium]|jgi:hydroxyacylglutathione hydrolase
MIHIEPISAFSDNYIWCLYNDAGDAVLVDPGDAVPVEAFLASRALVLSGILITHHHFDHVGGLEQLLQKRSIPVFGPPESAPQINQALADGDHAQLLGIDFEVLSVPGHTLDHIAYLAKAESPPLLFCGDTLFAGGCGRLFEGTPEQMHHSLSKLQSLPAATQMYCAHEYTLANLRFAQAVEPDNIALAERLAADTARRDKNIPTVPSTIALERATNPFLRSHVDEVRNSASDYASMKFDDDVATFAAVRHWKDQF